MSRVCLLTMLRLGVLRRAFTITATIRTEYVMGSPGLRDQTFFTEIIDEFPKPCERNYFNTFKSWTKSEIEEAVFNVILDNTKIPVADV